jgi:PAS domain S-box-containing protein
MPRTQQLLAQQMRELTAKLAQGGWDRLVGLRLLYLVQQVLGMAEGLRWLEAGGRAAALGSLLQEFIGDVPQSGRLAAALAAAEGLTELLEAGEGGGCKDADLLPSEPGDWELLFAGKLGSRQDALARGLIDLGFVVRRVSCWAEAQMDRYQGGKVLIAASTWLMEQAAAINAAGAVLERGCIAASLLVAVDDGNDQPIWLQTRRLGARLFLDRLPGLSRLIRELAGLAWMPRRPFRVLMVDDDAATLAFYAAGLRERGFAVTSLDDPLVAWRRMDELAPEVCVLDVEMPVCRGTDLAARLRGDLRYSRLPVIYLSGFADLAHQLDARRAGSDDYLVKPVDERLLGAAVLARARWYRGWERARRQRQQAWRELEGLHQALDAHTVLSIAARDGSIIDVNRRFCEVSGYSREELIGRNHRLLKSGHHPPAFYQTLWQTIGRGEIWQGELQSRRKDGSPFWVQATILPLLDEAGMPERYVAIRTDITQQKDRKSVV